VNARELIQFVGPGGITAANKNNLDKKETGVHETWNKWFRPYWQADALASCIKTTLF
jgi:hypothetical protein